jgi:serralysin
MPATTTISLSGNAYVDGILGDTRWATNTLTYSFPASASNYGTPYGNGEPGNNFGVLNATQQATVVSVLAMYASVANLTFTATTESNSNHGDIRFARSDAPSTAWAYYPNAFYQEGGDVWVNSSTGWYDSPTRGNYAYVTFIHEIGHALGLDHAHQGYSVPTGRDSMEYTVMSYRSYVGASTSTGYTNETWSFAQSLMMYDIAAVQYLYGANYTTNSGNTTYSWSSTTGEMFINGVGQGAPGANRIFLTVWDGGGVDTYDFSNYTTGLTINLAPGEWTTTSANQLAWLSWDGSQIADGNIANALLYNDDSRSLIENARGGSGNDSITGNRANNVLWGNGGNDVLNGGTGQDSAGYSGTSSNYSWRQNSDRSYTVTDLRSGSPDGTDRLYNMDTLVFQDRSVQIVDHTTVTTTDTGNQYSWAQASSNYDGNGTLDSVSIKTDDGRTYFTDYDQFSQYQWKEAISVYDSQNRLEQVAIVYDDNSIYFTYYDAGNAYTWTDLISGYDSQRRLDFVISEYDDGTFALTNYDQANVSDVNYSVHYYNVSDQLIVSYYVYDNGTVQIV